MNEKLEFLELNKIHEMYVSNAALLQSEKMKKEVKRKMGEVTENEIEEVINQIYHELKNMYYECLNSDSAPLEKILHINFQEYKLTINTDKIAEIKNSL